jgi:hypothetical protein
MHYSERDLSRIKVKQRVYQDRIKDWQARANSALSVAAFFGTFEFLIIAYDANWMRNFLFLLVGLVIIWCAIVFGIARFQITKYHGKSVVASAYIAAHTHDYTNLTNEKKDL